jgi:hypothetical protein
VFASCRGPTPKHGAVPHESPDASTPRPLAPHVDAAVVCAMPAGEVVAARAGVTRFTQKDPDCGPNGFCDTVDHAPDPKDLCFVANDNIARAERESRVVAPRSAPKSTRKPPGPRWLDRIDAHLHLGEQEQELLDANGFVVLDRERQENYATAFHEVFQQQLPIYVGVDAIFNAVYQASQMLLMEVETTRLAPRLARMLPRMRATLYASKAVYSAETIDDLDLYIRVAEKLLRGNSAEVKSPRSIEIEGAATDLAERARTAGELAEVRIFGRARMIDFTQYAPRGYYTGNVFGGRIKIGKDDETDLPSYFQAMTWLSRIEWNLVSRSCRSSQPGAMVDPTETPREARDAIALADLVARSGSLDDIRTFETTYSVFAGRREDVSPVEIYAMKIAPNAPNAPDALKAAIGDRWKRTARTHYMPEGAAELPAIATLFGPRIVPDVAPLTGLVHDQIPERKHIGFADVAYVLGHDRAKKSLEGDIATFPSLSSALDDGRAKLAASARNQDVYSTWIRAVTTLADKPRGAVPSFMRSEAYADMRMSSALAAYAQIRHTFVLLAGQGYDAYGCEIPDGWVEPAVSTYDALLAWSQAARIAAPQRAAYFRRVDQILGMLKSISQTELAGAQLSEPQRRWLGMVTEYIPVGGYGGDSGAPPKYTGWYYDLFPDRHHGAEREIDLVADYFTLTNQAQVRYLGVEGARTAVFVVDTGGEARAFVGPVAKPYQLSGPIEHRLDDEAARKAEGKTAPWIGYIAPEKPPPPLTASLVGCDADVRVIVEAPGNIGRTSVELLDHHRDAITPRAARDIGGGKVLFTFRVPRDAVEAFHLAVEDLAVSGVGRGRWDLVGRASAMPEQPTGVVGE